MQRISKWLLALSLAALLAPAPLLAQEISGSVEAGVAGMAISDDVKRVNEYSAIRGDRGVDGYGRIDLTGQQGGIAVDVLAERFSTRDQKYGVGLDLNRVFRLRSTYDTFLHWLDHDKIDYLDAGVRHPSTAVPGPVNGPGWVILSPDSIPGAFDQFDPISNEIRVAPTPGATNQQIGRATVYGEDFVPNQDFSIVRREWQNRAELALPFLPNVTVHAGYRIEEREGMEQSIGMSKCTVCHITGQSRQVDEQTRDMSVGATGKFGLLTVDYTYLDRQFEERAAAPTRVYDPTLNPGANYATSNPNFDNRTLYGYEDGPLPFDTIPDSDKKSHVVKARLDLARNTSVVGSFVNSKVESEKTDEPGIWTMDRKKLTTTYDAYGVRTSTRLTDRLTLTARAKLEELEKDQFTVTFQPINLTGNGFGGDPANIDPNSFIRAPHSVVSRDVKTFGLDAVYRMALRSNLRLGYEYQEEDREDEAFGKTETHTIKAGLKARPVRNVTARINYTYKDISNPFTNKDAALYQNPLTGEHYFDKDGNVATTFGDSSTWTTGYFLGNGPTYGVEFYDKRVADLTNLPETVHDARLSTTWSPLPNFAGTFTYRVKFEENDLDFSKWQQDTHNPGITLWYGPSNRLSLTLAYNYLLQTTESAFCQGWYDG